MTVGVRGAAIHFCLEKGPPGNNPIAADLRAASCPAVVFELRQMGEALNEPRLSAAESAGYSAKSRGYF